MRVFVAIRLPETVSRSVGELVSALRADLPAARWVRPENLHLTLAFLGEVEEGVVGGLTRALRSGCRAVPAFEAQLGSAGTFPERGRARVAWIGLGPESALERAERAVTSACLEAGASPTGRGRFHPHVTVARPRSGWGTAARRRWEAMVTPGLGGPFQVRSASLVESRLRPDGAHHRELAPLPLEVAA